MLYNHDGSEFVVQARSFNHDVVQPLHEVVAQFPFMVQYMSVTLIKHDLVWIRFATLWVRSCLPLSEGASRRLKT